MLWASWGSEGKGLGMKRVQFNHVGYLGGFPDRPEAKSNGVLVVDGDGLHMRGIRELFVIPWSAVVHVAVEGAEEASRRVTAGRVMAMGIFALAAKKKTGTTYLGVQTEGYTAGFEMEGTGAGEVRAKIAPWTQRLSPPPVPEAAPQAPQAAAPATTGLADELAKLAVLRDQGVLTQEEFDAQKARLLG